MRISVAVCLLYCVIFCDHALSAQSAPDVSLIQADSNWGKEVFSFPLSFAPEIEYQGVEEARFSKTWAKRDSAGFWSYAFAWKIETHASLTEADLENNLKLYFDGLMRSRSGKPVDELPPTIPVFILQTSEKNYHLFKGKIQIWDAFSTQKALVLNVTVEHFFCPQQHNAVLLFRLSPQNTEHPIWQQLNTLTLRDEIVESGVCR